MSVDVFLEDIEGNTTAVLSTITSLSYALVTNGVSILEIGLDGTESDIDDYDRNYRIKIIRNGNLEGGAPFFIKQKRVSLTAQGAYHITLLAFHSNWLLGARYTAYYATSAGARADDIACDDLLRQIAKQNLGSSAQTTHVAGVGDDNRDESAPDISLYFSVEADTSKGPTTDQSYARRKMLDVMQNIAEDSYQQGAPLYFGIEENSSGILVFKTRINQWGTDKRSDLIISPEYGNLTNVQRVWDWTEEATVSFGLGQGTTESRAVAIAKNDTLNNAHVLNWVETSINATQVSTTTALTRHAAAKLQSAKVKESFAGTLQDTVSFRYGTDWNWGDRVTAHFLGEEIDAWINQVSVNISGGKETINATLEKSA